ncbi:hypothetical protein D9M71_274670 [compost metagenome]
MGRQVVAYRCTVLCEQFTELQEGGAANAVHVLILSCLDRADFTSEAQVLPSMAVDTADSRVER